MKAAASAAAFVLFEQHAEAPARTDQASLSVLCYALTVMSEKYTANIRFYR